MKTIIWFALAMLFLVGCVSAEAADDAPSDAAGNDAALLPEALPTLSQYPQPGLHQLDVFMPADQSLNRSIYFTVGADGSVESDVLTAGHAFRAYGLLGDSGKWRLSIQQADRDDADCVTLIEFTALVDQGGDASVYPGTYRRECFNDKATATINDCFATYR